MPSICRYELEQGVAEFQYMWSSLGRLGTYGHVRGLEI